MATTISGTAGVTFPAGGLGNTAGAVVGTTDTQTLTNKTLTTPNIDSAQVATVSGTTPLYMARAWVNFNGTGTVAIRGSGNVSSITDNGAGDYTVNFTTAMSDVNYSAAGNIGVTNVRCVIGFTSVATYLTTSIRFQVTDPQTSIATDQAIVALAIFR